MRSVQIDDDDDVEGEKWDGILKNCREVEDINLMEKERKGGNGKERFDRWDWFLFESQDHS